MEWLETNPLPRVCQECKEAECYNCDYAGSRWYLAKVDELRLQRKGLLKSIEQQYRKIATIERQLKEEYGIFDF